MNKQQALDQLRLMQAWHEDNGNGPNADYDAICYAINIIEEAPEGLDNLIKALEKEHRALYCDNTPDTFSKLSYAEKSRVDELDTAIATLVNLPSAQPERWDTCFSCPLSHGCPVIKGCTNDQAEQYAGEIPTDCPLDKESAQPEDCDTCKHGYFGDGKCNNCRVRFPSHYERRTDD